MRIDLAGVFPPLTTPFDRSGRLDLGAFRSNLRAYRAYSLRGYLVLGSSGEAGSVDFDERIKLIETARKEIPEGKVLLVGTGAPSLKETLKLTQVAASNGADAALVLPPFYYKPAMTTAVMVQYYSELARAAKIPLMIYSIPQFTGIQLEVRAVTELSRKSNIIGLKESSGNLAYLAEIIESTPKRFQNVTGSALTFLPSLLAGAVGGILAVANVAPGECVEIFEDFKAGRMTLAARKQRALLRLARALTVRFGIAGLKAGVSAAGFQGGCPRSPLRALSRPDYKAVSELYQEMRANW
ncbi:MAG: dihydrodipicolinate synthase family protein [Acidobacteriia bacterium]|nr:dihydrodipicolinate synthase family protein [Terriglobia bacterium]